jgi:hypothetical protein
MFTQSKLTDFFARLAVGLALGLLAGLLISEVSYLLLPEKQAAQRAPQQIDLLIPDGTAERIQRGEFTSILPDEMIFVEGDVLQVKNEDSVAHQLGPLFVPPGVSSRLALDMANSYSYACSFETEQYVGLDVVPRTTLSVRLQGVLAIGLPSGMMLLVYSYLIPNESALGLRRRFAERRTAGRQSAASKDAP